MKKNKKRIIPALAVLINATLIPTVAAQCGTKSNNVKSNTTADYSTVEDIKAALIKSAEKVEISEDNFKQIKLYFGTSLTTNIIKKLGLKSNIPQDILERYNFKVYKRLDTKEVEVTFTKDTRVFTVKIEPVKFFKYSTPKEKKLDQLCSELSSSIIYHGTEANFKNLEFKPRVCTSTNELKEFKDDLLLEVNPEIFNKYENLKLTFSKVKSAQVFICDVNYDNMSKKVYLTIDKYKYLPSPVQSVDHYYKKVIKINYSFAKQQDFKNAVYDGDYAKFTGTVRNKGLNIKLPDPEEERVIFHAKKAKNSQDVTYTIQRKWAKKTFVIKYVSFQEQINNVALNLEDIKKTTLASYLTWNSFKGKTVTTSEKFNDAMTKLRLDFVKNSVHPRSGVTLKAKKDNNSTEITYQAWTGTYFKEVKINYKLFKGDFDFVNRMNRFFNDDKQKRSFTYNYERDFKNVDWKDTNKYFPKTMDAFRHLGLQQPFEKNNRFKIILTKNKGTTVVNYRIVSNVYNNDPKYDSYNEYKKSFNVKIIHFGIPGHF